MKLNCMLKRIKVVLRFEIKDSSDGKVPSPASVLRLTSTRFVSTELHQSHEAVRGRARVEGVQPSSR